MPDFQLLSAEAAPVNVSTLWRREPVWMHPQIRLAHQAASLPAGDVGNLTAIIGQNGTGKTHLLSAIIQSLLMIEELKRGRRPRLDRLPLQHLAYRIGGSLCELRREGGATLGFMDGQPVRLADLPLPERIVALTTTPFDKFHIPRLAAFSVAPEEQSRYRYLGLRDRTGRASIENLLFRSLNSLFETSSNPAMKRARISRVFSFLGLKPRLTVVYRVRIAREVVAACRTGQPLLNENAIRDRIRLGRSKEVVKSGQATEEELRAAILHATEIQSDNFIRIEADFDAGGVVDAVFARFQPIRRAGFLQLTAVEVEQVSGLLTDLRRASSGQISIAIALLSLASEIQDGSLVLIDEPELSLHPDWQVRYVDLLLDTFRGYRGCHFMIATHSPLVVSELPPHASLVALDDPSVPSAPELAGQSADVLLAEAFHMSSRNNLHVRDLLADALKAAADGEAGTSEFGHRLAHLERLTDRLPDDDGVRVVVTGLRSAAERAGEAVHAAG